MDNKSTTPISQAAIAYLSVQKNNWLEAQALNAIDQVIKLQDKVKQLEQIIEEKNKEGK